jgi:glycosyltransferase involved in cell wall biosynthesis
MQHSYKILHISVHLGGGIGTVLLNWIKQDTKNKHTILCLNRNYYNTYDPNIVYENMRNKYEEINTWVEQYDVVIIHFWNHPLLFEFLISVKLVPARICFWSHASGLNAPYVFSEKLINFSDKFIFSSPISYEAKEIKNLSENSKEKLNHIWTTGNIDDYFEVRPLSHDEFNIGCIGTLDYSKLHPKFVDMCSKINIPNCKFIMCGTGADEELIKQQVKEKGLEDRFIFTGIVKDIKPYLAIIDVFGYPLNPNHFGTCEQVLGEAMAAGVIPIVMKNPAEEYILFQSLIKFICSNEDEYVHNIELLYRERKNKSRIVSFMQKHVTELYDSAKMVSSWESVFSEIIKKDKKEKCWSIADDSTKTTGYKIFIESLGDYGKILEQGTNSDIKNLFNSNLQWKSSSKGSPRQYLATFPEDNTLKKWCNLID